MKKLVLFYFVLGMPALAMAQNKAASTAHISGRVLDENGNPLASVNVVVRDTTGSKVVTGAYTEKDGRFAISLNPGTYILNLSFVSYKSYQKRISLGKGEHKSLGTIKLQSASQQLRGTVVRAEKSQMTMQFDRRVFNVGQDITSLGGSAINVLRNVPSISMDINGNISLRGNQSVRVLINGHTSHMVSNGIQALRSIPANLIKKVEIITNPSSKYSAEGSAGIINIILVKNRQLGFNGSVQAGTGYPQDHEVSANLNYQKGNFNWFLNSSLNYRADPESGNSFQRFSGPDTTYMYREHTDSDEGNWDGNLRLGTDYYITKTQTLTASTFISPEKQTDDEDVTYTDLQYSPGAFDGDVLQKKLRSNNQDQREHNYDFNLRYIDNIDGDAQKLTANARFELSTQNTNTDIKETFLQGSGSPLYQRTNDGENEKQMRLNVEYKQPLGKQYKLEAGLRSDTHWNDNSYYVAQRENGVYQPLDAYNGDFLYMENVNAAYATLGTQWGHFSTQLGLRAENTRIRTEITETNKVNNQNYLNLFPSVFLNYSFNQKNSVQLSYSRRLSRPWSRELIPFSDYSNSRSEFVGNPDLKPEYSNSYEAGYLRDWNSGSLLTSFYYRHRTDVTERISEQNQGVLRRFPINLAAEKAWGIEFSGNQDIIEGLNIRANANFYKSNRHGRYQDQVFNSEARSFRSRLRLRWDFNSKWHLQASMRYRGPHQTTQGHRDGIKSMDTALSHDLWNGKARIALSVRDLFNSQNFNHIATTDGNPNTDFYSQQSYRWSSRSFSISFRYFFTSNQKPKHRRGGHRHH